MAFKYSGGNLLALPIGISAGIHTLLIVGLIFLSWKKTTPKPEIAPIKIANVLLEPKKTKPIQKINRENISTITQQKVSKSEKRNPTTLKAPFQPARQHTSNVPRKRLTKPSVPVSKNLDPQVQPAVMISSPITPSPISANQRHKSRRSPMILKAPFQPARQHTSNVSRKRLTKPSVPVSKNLDPQIQPVVMISGPITPSPILANQRHKPRLIEFLSTEPTPLTAKTVLQEPSTPTAKSPRTPTPWLEKTIASFSKEEILSSPVLPVMERAERGAPLSKANPVYIASMPSGFIGDKAENSASSKSSHPDGEMDSSIEDMGFIRKEFSFSVWERIANAKHYPLLAQKRGWEGRPVIEFKLARNGELLTSSIALSSPHKILNEAALGAVKNAVPYPKFPKALKLDSIRFKLPISFILAEP